MHTLRSVRNSYFKPKILKNDIFSLKNTMQNEYVFELSVTAIRNLISPKNRRNQLCMIFLICWMCIFYQKFTILTQISKRSTVTVLHHPDLGSGGQRHLEKTKKLHAYAKTTYCWHSAGLTVRTLRKLNRHLTHD